MSALELKALAVPALELRSFHYVTRTKFTIPPLQTSVYETNKGYSKAAGLSPRASLRWCSTLFRTAEPSYRNRAAAGRPALVARSTTQQTAGCEITVGYGARLFQRYAYRYAVLHLI